MKTNVSIKFNSIKEYREIERKLVELGYENDINWNYGFIMEHLIKKYNPYYYIIIYQNLKFEIHNHKGDKDVEYNYNSLQEFLND